MARLVQTSKRGKFVKRKILIVDDEALLVRTLSQAFREAGWEVTARGSAEEAQQLLDTKTSFDLLLLDNRLPGKSGIELLEELGKPAGTCVVLMTAYDTDETYKRGLNLGADLYLKKPFDLEALLNKALELTQKGAKA